MTVEHPLLIHYFGVPGWMLLLAIGGASLGFFVYQVQKAIRLVLVGGPDHRTDAWFSRVIEVATGWLGQKRVLEDRVVGVLHVLMFWGFLMLSSDMLDPRAVRQPRGGEAARGSARAGRGRAPCAAGGHPQIPLRLIPLSSGLQRRTFLHAASKKSKLQVVM